DEVCLFDPDEAPRAALAVPSAVSDVESDPGANLHLRRDRAVAQRGERGILVPLGGTGHVAEGVTRQQVGAAERDAALNGQAISANPAVRAQPRIEAHSRGEPRVAA